MTNKKTQHDSLNVEQTLISSEAFIDKYKKPIMYVFIAIVVLVGGYFLYRSFVSEPREAKANDPTKILKFLFGIVHQSQ